MEFDRRLAPRVKYTALSLWGRWIRMSMVRKIAAAVLFTIGVTGLSFAGCNADKIAGPGAPSSTTPPSRDLVSGEAVAVVLQNFFQSDDQNACTGELVHTDGTVNSRFHIALTASGKYHVKVHYNTQGNTGYMVTGPGEHPFPHPPAEPFVGYKVIENDDAELHFDEVVLPYNSQYTAKLWLKRDGEDLPAGDDYFEHIVADFKVSVDPLDPTNISVTQELPKVWVRCQ